jgi:hypothetical protein
MATLVKLNLEGVEPITTDVSFRRQNGRDLVRFGAPFTRFECIAHGSIAMGQICWLESDLR